MICKNCGAEIRKRESYCPQCGMELLIPYSKSLKEKYMAGEYSDHEDKFISRDRNVNRLPENEYQYENSSEYTDNEYEQYQENEDNEEYETNSSSSGIGATILFLVVALLIGFVIGMIIFSGSMQSILGMPTI